MMGKNVDIIEVLENLNTLRYFDGDISEFWAEYLENIADLAKSEIAIIIKKDTNSLSLYKEYINSEKISEEIKDKLLSSVSSCANRAIENLYSFEKSSYENRFLVAISLDEIDEDNDYILLLLCENLNKQDFTNIILRTLLCKDIPQTYILNNSENPTTELTKEIATNQNDHITQVLYIINSIIYEKKFKLASMNVVDELANRFGCSKVSLGWIKHGFVKTVAISYVESFLDSSYAIKSLEAVFEESTEQDIEIFYPLDKDSEIISNSHQFYTKENILDSVYTFPIRVEEEVVGAVTLEKIDKPFSEIELEVIRLCLNFLTPILDGIHQKDQDILQKGETLIKNSFESFLGPENTIKKAFIVFGSILFLWLVFGKLEYKVESVTTIETDNIEYVSAPFDGVVKSVNVSLGDSVKKGDLLVSFDTKELLLNKVEINSNIIKYTTEEEKARSNRELANMKVAIAQKQQSLATLEKVDYSLSKANKYATFDGVVVDGDREKIEGSPFNKGDLVMQIANPTDLYAKIKVEEQYIDEIKVGQIAEINLLSRPDEYFDVKIDKIIPMANVDSQNGNIFILKVVFIDPVQEWMRPGMSGVAKVKIEDRTILWILTHKISDFLHMHIWW
jgi:multidrug efflux pump subunit AcrA (membrane-fusion protein)